MPTVSIIMPILNAEAFLPEAICSVLDQTTAESWELLLIDDGSEDGSRQIAQSFARRFPQCIRFLQHAQGANRGTSCTRNLGLREARGEFLAFLDADDCYLPWMLEHQLELLKRFPKAALAYANAERTWQMDQPYSPRSGPCGLNELPDVLPPGVASGLLPLGQPLQWFLQDETLVPCTCTVLVRTAVARAVGGFHENFEGLYDDQAFYARIMLDHAVAVSTACVARYRRHAASCCGQTWHDEPLQQAARQRFLDWLESYQAQAAQAREEELAAAD